MEEKKDFNLTKENYIIIGVAIFCIVLGFVLTSGSATELEFNPDIFSTRRITVGPMLSFAGFLLMIVGILYKKKNKKTE